MNEIPVCACGVRIHQARTGPKRSCCAACSHKKKRENERAKRDADPEAYRDASRGHQRKWRKNNPDKAKREYDRELYRSNWAKRVLGSIKGRARRRGLDFDLSEADLVIPEYCPALGMKLEIGDGGAWPNSPSVDRVDSSKGYVKGNVQIISLRANELKSNGTVGEIERVVAWMKAVGAP